MKAKKKEYKKMLSDIFSLILKINETTEYNCFFELAPHCCLLRVGVYKGDNWTNVNYHDFYYDGELADDLKCTSDMLKKLLHRTS